LALTSPTGGGRSVGIVRVRTKATEFSFSLVIKVPEYPFSGSRVVPCGRTDRQHEAFRNFANAPKSDSICS